MYRTVRTITQLWLYVRCSVSQCSILNCFFKSVNIILDLHRISTVRYYNDLYGPQVQENL